MSFNKKVLENNERCVFAKIYILDRILKNIFFPNKVKVTTKCSDGAAKCFKRSEIVRRLVLM